jgi:nucleotide-binding universal stress UspA family protein
MLHLLIGLDGSETSSAAVELGIAWARRYQAMLIGIGVIDEPTIARAAPVALGGPPYADPVFYRRRIADATRQVEGFLESFALECTRAGIAFKLLEDVGLPCEKILRESQRYDAILLGSRTRFHFETQERIDETLPRAIRDSPRPVIVVPADGVQGQATLIAFDGSLQAARALQAFVSLGVADPALVHVLTIEETKVRAAGTAERAIDYLRHRGIRAQAHAVKSEGPIAAAILQQAAELDAGLVVLGAYGRPMLKEFVLGSVTRTMLRESRVPLLLSH